jgi:hypothetical protein
MPPRLALPDIDGITEVEIMTLTLRGRPVHERLILENIVQSRQHSYP